jgi:hypothetical protein
VEDDTKLAEQIVATIALGPRRVAYDLKPFSQERASGQIGAFYQRVIRRRQQKAIA